jgi:SAM-dependent methyltransferase
MKENTIYSDARLYDLFFGQPVSGEALMLYRDLIAEYGEPVLELACGTGKITIPLHKEGVDITGLDLSKEMVDHGLLKDNTCKLLEGDMRNFDLSRLFGFIFIPAQSFQHMITSDDIQRCFGCVRKHLKDNGAFLIQIFTPNLRMLQTNPGERLPTSKEYYQDDSSGTKYKASISHHYDAAGQVMHSTYYYSSETDPGERSFTLSMRQFFPQEMDVLAEQNGFRIIEKFSDNQRTPFDRKPVYQNILLAKK